MYKSKCYSYFRKNIDKLYIEYLCENPNAIHLLAKLDYPAMQKQCQSFCKELVAYVLHPVRISKFSNAFNLDFDEYVESLGFDVSSC